MSVIPCPRCQQPLQVPKPTPDHIRCAHCGTTIKNTARQPKPVIASAIAQGAPAAMPVAASAAIREGVPVAAMPNGTPAGSTLAGPDVAKKGNSRKMIGITAGVAFVMGLCLWLLLRGSPEQNVTIDVVKDATPLKKTQDPRVKKSVEAGVAFLRRHIHTITATLPKTSHKGRQPAPPGGRFFGELGLIGVTLLECGVPADDPDVQDLAELVRKAVPQISETYGAAPIIFFLDRLHQGRTMPEDDRKRIQTLALRLVKGQNRPINLWSYNIPILTANEEESLLAKLRDKADDYETTGGGADTSNSQFAALALWTSRKSGVPVDAALRKAAATARKYQNAKTGTLNYQITNENTDFKDTGTCVGLILLALGRAVSDTKETTEFLEEPAVDKALQHLGKLVKDHADNYEKTKPATHPLIGAKAFGDLYFLWTLERTCLILGLKSLGDHDWHRWGTEILLDHQILPKELPSGEFPPVHGSWNNVHGPGPDTCFALLFLMQANLFQDLTDKLNLGVSATPPQMETQPANKQ